MGTSRNIRKDFSVKEKDLGLFCGEEDKKSENNFFDTIHYLNIQLQLN